MTYLLVGLGLARGGQGPGPGSRDNAPAWCLSTFPVTQCSLSSQTKKYADVIIPRGADNEGKDPDPAVLTWQPALGYCCCSGVRLEVAGPATEGTQATATRERAVTTGVLR